NGIHRYNTSDTSPRRFPASSSQCYNWLVIVLKRDFSCIGGAPRLYLSSYTSGEPSTCEWLLVEQPTFSTFFVLSPVRFYFYFLLLNSSQGFIPKHASISRCICTAIQSPGILISSRRTT